MTAFIDDLKKKYTEWKLLADDTTQKQLEAKINEITFQLKQGGVSSPASDGFVTTFSLGSAQTGDADTTDTFDYGNDNEGREPLLVKIAATGTTTPTCTYAIKGSLDNVNFFDLEYADSTTPTTFSTGTFALTPTSSTVTTIKVVKGGQHYRYLKVVYSSNTAVTNTADVLPLGD